MRDSLLFIRLDIRFNLYSAKSQAIKMTYAPFNFLMNYFAE